ncbi:ADP-dependent NAD(P)H-hydrate dehydratase [Marisediminicola senii]|uniref:ADP-dependent NAD(P)H-hydrate dehydratase n=1 Tax=Marisediminicola senii TaxID=2711233 RepID=UPI001F3DE096|nr:ADP/ATP-dependent (S)-NAD(P)H-hydrate dehydratase [Marisediminicola senii]
MTYREWTTADTRDHIAVPTADDDKYSRGVLGVRTGSTQYPGAAVLGVEAAMRCGVGMLRYLGPAVPSQLVLQRRPEVVTSPGRVQAWLLGSGMDAAARDTETETALHDALDEAHPVVLDAGALDLVSAVTGPAVITPHGGELSRLLGVDRERITADPAGWAARAADQLGVTVLLKGSATHVADPHGSRFVVSSPVAWTATAGAGDALGGILGAVVATNAASIADDPAALARLAATAAVVHRVAAARASAGGPLVVLDLAVAVSATVAELLGH